MYFDCISAVLAYDIYTHYWSLLLLSKTTHEVIALKSSTAVLLYIKFPLTDII